MSKRRPPSPQRVAAAYDAIADDYDRRHQDARSARRFRVIDGPQREAARRARRVLEIGCGTGRLLAELEAPVRVGVDVSAAMLRRARARGLAVVRADAHALPFGDASFEAVLAAKGVFRYLDDARALAECARVLTPGGRLVVHQYAARTWSLRLLWERLGRAPRSDPEGLHLGHPDELHAPARRVGLTPVSIRLWRSVRMPPYALPIPTWLPGSLWSHCVIVYEKVTAPAWPRRRRRLIVRTS